MPETSIQVTPGSGAGIDVFRAAGGNYRQAFVLADPSTSANIVAVTAAGEIAVNPGTGTFSVNFSPANPSVNIGTPTIQGITNTINVAFSPANPSVNIGSPTVSLSGFPSSLAVYFDRGNPSVNINSQTGTINVALDPGHTLGNIGTVTTVTGITNTVHVDFQGSNPSVNVSNASLTVAPTVAFNSGVVGTTTQRVVHATDDVGSINIVAQSLAFLNVAYTASIFTVSGSTSGVSTSGVTIVSPSANYSFKVFAYSLKTTGITSLTCKFTNGSGASPTEFWRPLITPGTPTGENLFVPPPSFIFATGNSTTLALVLDSGSLVHYSVSYIKETA